VVKHKLKQAMMERDATKAPTGQVVIDGATSPSSTTASIVVTIWPP